MPTRDPVLQVFIESPCIELVDVVHPVRGEYSLRGDSTAKERLGDLVGRSTLRPSGKDFVERVVVVQPCLW